MMDHCRNSSILDNQDFEVRRTLYELVGRVEDKAKMWLRGMPVGVRA